MREEIDAWVKERTLFLEEKGEMFVETLREIVEICNTHCRKADGSQGIFQWADEQVLTLHKDTPQDKVIHISCDGLRMYHKGSGEFRPCVVTYSSKQILWGLTLTDCWSITRDTDLLESWAPVTNLIKNLILKHP